LSATVVSSLLIVITLDGCDAYATFTVAETVMEGHHGDDGRRIGRQQRAAPTVTPVNEAALQAVLDEWRSDLGPVGATLSIRVPGFDDIHVASASDAGTPISTDESYGIASVTKTFTAAVALQLVQAGQLSLDVPIECWLPDLPGADQITLDMLLSQTSGLGDVPGQPPLGEPGDHFSYSNGGFAVIGQLIERLIGQDLATVIDERLTGPLALDDTSLSPTNTDPTRAADAMTSNFTGPARLGRDTVLGRPARRRHHGDDAGDAQPLPRSHLWSRRHGLLPRPGRLHSRQGRTRRPQRNRRN
jgi:CubicO group peptidase (beta-lactamase class C family)